MPGGTRPPGGAPQRHAAGARARVGRGPGSRGDRVAPARGAAPGQRLMTPVPAEIFPRGLAGALAVMLALVLAAGGSLVAGSPGSPPTAAARDRAAGPAGGAPRVTHDLIRLLRRRGDRDAVTRLLAIAHGDPAVDIQHDAVDALGKLRSGDALAAVIDIARTHPNEDLRREAVETVGRKIGRAHV